MEQATTTIARDPILVDFGLQGGGSHGAFTWGVLDQLLEDERIRIEAVSGTSAGARIGSTSSKVAVTSRKQPSTSNSPLMISRNCQVAKPWPITKVTSWLGMPDSVIQWPKASAVATISMMVAALRMPSVITFSVCVQ